MAAKAGFNVQTHNPSQGGIFSKLGNWAAGATESPEQKEVREGLGAMSSGGVLIGVVMAVVCVAVAFFALVEGSFLGFFLAAMMAFASIDFTIFSHQMSQIAQHPVNFITFFEGQQGAQMRVRDIANKAAEPTLLLKHVIAFAAQAF